MTHRNKGIMGVRFEYYHDVLFDIVQIQDFENVRRASNIALSIGDDCEE